MSLVSEGLGGLPAPSDSVLRELSSLCLHAAMEALQPSSVDGESRVLEVLRNKTFAES